MTSRGGAVAVIGAGSWGTALAVQLGRSGMAVRLWARDPELARAAIHKLELGYAKGSPKPKPEHSSQNGSQNGHSSLAGKMGKYQ